MATAVMFILLAVFMAIGVPIGICISLPLFAMILIEPITTPEFLSQVFYSGIASFTLVACPFFILSGSVMETGGLSKRLVRVAGSAACGKGAAGKYPQGISARKEFDCRNSMNLLYCHYVGGLQAESC